MSQAQFTIPLITVIPGQLITAALWNNEFTNLQTNLNPSGIGGYSDTDTQMQIQTAPYPGSVTSHASSTAGELERIRYQISAILGATTPAYWYAAPQTNLVAVANQIIPIGGVIDFPSATAPNSNFLLANGQAIGRTAYASLFTLIGTTFGIGDGSNTFNIPNYTDRMSIAAGNLYALAATGGSVAGVLSITDPGHTHTQNAHTHTDSGHTHTSAAHTHVVTADNRTNGNFLTNASTHYTDNVTTPTGSTTPGPTGSSTANISSTTSTENSQTTGISGTAATLPPYLGMYKMIRVL